jgi:hypothetical protein
MPQPPAPSHRSVACRWREPLLLGECMRAWVCVHRPDVCVGNPWACLVGWPASDPRLQRRWRRLRKVVRPGTRVQRILVGSPAPNTVLHTKLCVHMRVCMCVCVWGGGGGGNRERETETERDRERRRRRRRCDDERIKESERGRGRTKIGKRQEREMINRKITQWGRIHATKYLLTQSRGLPGAFRMAAEETGGGRVV